MNARQVSTTNATYNATTPPAESPFQHNILLVITAIIFFIFATGTGIPYAAPSSTLIIG